MILKLKKKNLSLPLCLSVGLPLSLSLSLSLFECILAVDCCRPWEKVCVTPQDVKRGRLWEIVYPFDFDALSLTCAVVLSVSFTDFTVTKFQQFWCHSMVNVERNKRWCVPLCPLRRLKPERSVDSCSLGVTLLRSFSILSLSYSVFWFAQVLWGQIAATALHVLIETHC